MSRMFHRAYVKLCGEEAVLKDDLAEHVLHQEDPKMPALPSQDDRATVGEEIPYPSSALRKFYYEKRIQHNEGVINQLLRDAGIGPHESVCNFKTKSLNDPEELAKYILELRTAYQGTDPKKFEDLIRGILFYTIHNMALEKFKEFEKSSDPEETSETISQNFPAEVEKLLRDTDKKLPGKGKPSALGFKLMKESVAEAETFCRNLAAAAELTKEAREVKDKCQAKLDAQAEVLRQVGFEKEEKRKEKEEKSENKGKTAATMQKESLEGEIKNLEGSIDKIRKKEESIEKPDKSKETITVPDSILEYRFKLAQHEERLKLYQEQLKLVKDPGNKAFIELLIKNENTNIKNLKEAKGKDDGSTKEQEIKEAEEKLSHAQAKVLKQKLDKAYSDMELLARKEFQLKCLEHVSGQSQAEVVDGLPVFGPKTEQEIELEESKEKEYKKSRDQSKNKLEKLKNLKNEIKEQKNPDPEQIKALEKKCDALCEDSTKNEASLQTEIKAILECVKTTGVDGKGVKHEIYKLPDMKDYETLGIPPEYQSGELSKLIQERVGKINEQIAILEEKQQLLSNYSGVSKDSAELVATSYEKEIKQAKEKLKEEVAALVHEFEKSKNFKNRLLYTELDEFTRKLYELDRILNGRRHIGDGILERAHRALYTSEDDQKEAVHFLRNTYGGNVAIGIIKRHGNLVDLISDTGQILGKKNKKPINLYGASLEDLVMKYNLAHPADPITIKYWSPKFLWGEGCTVECGTEAKCAKWIAFLSEKGEELMEAKDNDKKADASVTGQAIDGTGKSSASATANPIATPVATPVDDDDAFRGRRVHDRFKSSVGGPGMSSS